MKKYHFVIIGGFLGIAAPAYAATLTALTSFGGGDGWLAPAEFSIVPGNDLARGVTYNPVTNRIYYTDRTGGTFIRILNADTGASVGTLNMTGVTGGTHLINQIDVDANGVIYAANLSTTAAENFKVYRWADDSAAPTVAYDALTGRVRTGDSFAVTGTGVTTQFVSAGGTTGTNYSLFTTANGSTFTSSNPTLTGAPAGGFRLGIDFGPAGSVLGKQTGSTTLNSASSAGAVTTTTLSVTGEAPLEYLSAGPNSLLATIDTSTSRVFLYDMTLAGPALSSLNNTTAFLANGNGVGDLKFGVTGSGEIRLYALNANNGIQAFVVIPEPTTLLLGGLGLGMLLRRRRK